MQNALYLRVQMRDQKNLENKYKIIFENIFAK